MSNIQNTLKTNQINKKQNKYNRNKTEQILWNRNKKGDKWAHKRNRIKGKPLYSIGYEMKYKQNIMRAMLAMHLR